MTIGCCHIHTPIFPSLFLPSGLHFKSGTAMTVCVSACVCVCMCVCRTGGGRTIGCKGASWMGLLSLLSQIENHLPSHFKPKSFTLYKQAFILHNYSRIHMYTRFGTHIHLHIYKYILFLYSCTLMQTYMYTVQ